MRTDELVNRIEEATRPLWAMPESPDRKRLETFFEGLARCGVREDVAWRHARRALISEILQEFSLGKQATRKFLQNGDFSIFTPERGLGG